MTSLGKVLILFGVFIVLAGIALTFWEKIPFVGKLPGDIYLKKGDSSLYFPITTSVLISLLLTVLVNILWRLFGK